MEQTNSLLLYPCSLRSYSMKNEFTMSLSHRTTVPSRPHVLIVDDEAELCQTVSLLLEQAGFAASTAENVQDACDLLEQGGFDVVITDVMMPGDDGISLLGRARLITPEIPVILMTGYAQLQMAVAAIKNGAFDFVHKPFDFGHLLKIVERAVNYTRLQKMEKKYRVELEETVTRRTAELKRAMCELDAAKSALLRSADEKNQFMSNVSHEMRTPMNGVMGGLFLLDDEVTTTAGREYLEMVRQSSDKMVALIDQLLLFGRGSAGNGAARYDLIDTAKELNTIVAGHQPAFERKSLFLALHIAPDIPGEIWTDKERFTRLFSILLGNALKFTKKGGVTFTARRGSATEGENECLHFTVTDSGIGIPEEMLERIFEPFIQGDGSHTRHFGGLGLGLAIAAQNAHILNGRLWAEHVPEGGSRFNFSMKIIT